MAKGNQNKISVVVKTLKDSAKEREPATETPEPSEYEQELEDILDFIDFQEKQQWGFYYST